MRVLLAVCIAVALGEIASAQEHALSKGAGAASCAQYAKAYQMRPDQTDDLFLSWAVGFMSAFNFVKATMGGASFDLAAKTPNEMTRYRRAKCEIRHSGRFKLCTNMPACRRNDPPHHEMENNP
jgi:hypothetical protein